MTEHENTPVTVLGLGDMGTALAAALLAAGHPTTVWNRSASKAEPLVAKGASHAATPAEAVAASPLVIACLLDHRSMHGVLDPVADALGGKVLVNLTTGTPEEADELASWAGKNGVDGFLDGGIMAVPSMIGGPGAFVLYSGSRDAFDQHEPTLRVLGTPDFAGTAPGRAALLDFALLSGFYGMMAGSLQAMALVGTDGISATEFTAERLIPLLQAMTGALPELAQQVDIGDYAAKESNLAMQTSGIGLVGFAKSRGVSAALVEPIEAMMRQRVADGHGGDDLSSVIELIRNPQV